MSDAQSIPSKDRCDDELIQALKAAFGDDAMSLLEETDQEVPAEIMAALGGEISTASSVSCELDSFKLDPGPSWSKENPGNLIDVLPCQSDSPRTRWMKNLNAAIYSGRLKSDQDNNEPTERLLVFAISDLHYSLPLADVREIARYPKVTALPCTPSWLRGVANFRGQIISVTDFRNLIQDSSQRPTVGEKVVVVHSQEANATTALVVDRVVGIRSATSDSVDLSCESEEITALASGTHTIDDVTIVAIDPNRLFKRTETTPIPHQLS